jgi:glutamyl/glutaminyl-tRNA synthetase
MCSARSHALREFGPALPDRKPEAEPLDSAYRHWRSVDVIPGVTVGPEASVPVERATDCAIDIPGAPYRGRLAPSPTGYLHLGHARTFWIAQQRARMHRGTIILRNEDLDHSRVRPEFVDAMLTDLTWFGLEWTEGPDRGGPFKPYTQSQRRGLYRRAFERLQAAGHLYPCSCSRKDITQALTAPHDVDDEPVYPGTCRPMSTSARERPGHVSNIDGTSVSPVNWRFRVPDGEVISFIDRQYGPQQFLAGKDFGDFVVWRHDQVPAYQLAVVVDDHAMRITEVVRGADLLRSTARQMLLYRALGFTAPDFFHCPLMTDGRGSRLAKRHDALSLRTLRAQGRTPEELRSELLAFSLSWSGTSMPRMIDGSP